MSLVPVEAEENSRIVMAHDLNYKAPRALRAPRHRLKATAGIMYYLPWPATNESAAPGEIPGLPIRFVAHR